MIRLLVIVPYPELKEIVDYVLAHHPERERLDADVQVMTVEDTPDVPADEYDAIIARGYSAQKTIARYKNIPTICLDISGYDMLRAVIECQKLFHPGKIAICGFESRLFEAEEICRMVGVNAAVFAPVLHDDLEKTMERILASGCDAVVGGYSACILAEHKGIQSVVIKTGQDTVARAVDEAVRTVDRIRGERVISQMYKTIIYSSEDGLLYVDRNGVIRVRNRVVRQMNGDVSLMDRKLKTVLPYLYKDFETVMTGGLEQSGRILTIPGTKTRVSVSCRPVIANKEISGAVICLSDITLIQNLESQIRRKLSERGLKARYTFDDILHESGTMKEPIETARRYAATDSNVIIVGETGTGKELFAQSIHNSSRRKNGPFVAINCAALPENLLESELFGYVEGAFTGTSRGGKMGLFEQAHGGTLFLDEVEEISLSTQSKLLRTLQEKQVRRSGDNKVIDIDVRILSATNKSITRLSEEGGFRKDLMYRLDVLRLFLPPLRQRERDVEFLFCHLLGKLCQDMGVKAPVTEPEALELLYQYPFMGNIRELGNIAERALVLGDGSILTKEELSRALYPRDLEEAGMEERKTETKESGTACTAFPADPLRPEQERILEALERCGGSRVRAAGLLGMDRSTLWRRLKMRSRGYPFP